MWRFVNWSRWSSQVSSVEMPRLHCGRGLSVVRLPPLTHVLGRLLFYSIQMSSFKMPRLLLALAEDSVSTRDTALWSVGRVQAGFVNRAGFMISK